MPVRKREQRSQKPEGKDATPDPPMKKINKMPETPMATGNYAMKHFMMLYLDLRICKV